MVAVLRPEPHPTVMGKELGPALHVGGNAEADVGGRQGYGLVHALQDLAALGGRRQPPGVERPLGGRARRRDVLGARPGEPARFDYEYARNGVSNLFMVVAPLEGWRHVKGDWAPLIKELVNEHYPEKAKIILGMDNLNTHKLGSLYEPFAPARAHRIAARLEIHYTPKHGSWLNMAEIEIGIRARQCLNRRLPDQAALKREINVWQNARNHKASRADWRVTTADARIRSKSLYPSVQSCRSTRRI